MVARLDHITVVAPSLETGSAYVEAALGVPPCAGRAHPAWPQSKSTISSLTLRNEDGREQVLSP
jgi:hypothetical protein